MGFLAVIGALIFGAGYINNELTHSYYDQKFYEDAKAKGQDTYVDSHGKHYDMKTGRQILGWRRNGHNIAIDVKTGEVIRDFTQEQNEEKERRYLNEAIKNGERFYMAITINPTAYRDRVTGKLYAKGGGSITGYHYFYRAEWDEKHHMMMMVEPYESVRENKMP